ILQKSSSLPISFSLFHVITAEIVTRLALTTSRPRCYSTVLLVELRNSLNHVQTPTHCVAQYRIFSFHVIHKEKQMSKAASSSKAVDRIQQGLTDYAVRLSYESLSPAAIRIAKERVIDTLGALVVGFFGEPCQIARNVAAAMPDPRGATVVGTRMKTTPDMAAF